MLDGSHIYEDGFPLGRMVRSEAGNKASPIKPALNNHIAITILYHEEPTTAEPATKDGTTRPALGIRVVGFEVKAYSVNHATDYPEGGHPNTCEHFSSTPIQVLEEDKEITIVFTYSATWVRSDIKWASRWDSYFMMTDDQVHWFSILNSSLVVLFLTGIVAMILLRVLRADLRRYNAQRDDENNDVLEETGWKLVHADVFRAPAWPMLLAASVGSGVQTLAMTVITMGFAMLGFLSPANRGSLMTAMVVLLVVMGVLNGYFSSRTYKMFKGVHWKRCTLLSMFLYPGMAFGIFLVINFLISGQHSSGAMPFLTLLELITLWFGVSLPLTFAGAYFGNKGEVVPEPSNIRINLIPRQIPDQLWYTRPIVSILLGGVLPFGAILIELFFIWSSIWLHQFYYLFGFLFLVFVILAITCAEITIVMCYFQLCSEDYHWWWRAFLTPATSALYLFFFSVFYFMPKLQITKFVSICLYTGYTLIITLEFFTLTGVVGFFSCYWFVYTIFIITTSLGRYCERRAVGGQASARASTAGLGGLLLRAASGTASDVTSQRSALDSRRTSSWSTLLLAFLVFFLPLDFFFPSFLSFFPALSSSSC